MTAAALAPARQEALLDLAGKLAERLRQVRVSFTDGQPADIGLARNCVGKVEGLLRHARDLDEFRAALELLDQLDPIEAQNAQHPKDQYTLLRDELRRFLTAHSGHAPEEWMFVLGWVRRLLPARARSVGKPRSRRDEPRPDARRDAVTSHPSPPAPAEAPPPARPASAGERLWKATTLALERGRVVARKGRDRVAEDTAGLVPRAVVQRLRQNEKVVADVAVVPGIGSGFRIAGVRSVR